MTRKMRRLQRVHFVGIGGSGMSGIAEVMIGLGYEIQGSDIRNSNQLRRLEALGAKIYIGHSRKNIFQADAVVVSSAIQKDNCEVREAYKLMLPVVARAEMLAELMRFYHSVAVAGTHGKTTTTSLIATVLAGGELDPTYIIGGCLKSSDSHAKLGLGEYLVAEADESDASFTHFKPMISVVTNIDLDHMSTYDNDANKLHKGFIDFLHNLPFYGLAIMCIDDTGIQKILPSIARSVVTYGVSESADIHAKNINFSHQKTLFEVIRKNKKGKLKIQINLPGIHNVQNALAAIAVASELEVPDESIILSLKNFAGIDRRFQVTNDLPFKGGVVTLIDDYGHHPTEILATLNAIHSGWEGKKITLVFQPHRYTRTKELFDEFVDALSQVEQVIITDIYSAGEAPIDDINGMKIINALENKMASKPIFAESLNTIPAILNEKLQDGEILLLMGAGDIGNFANDLPKLLKKDMKNTGDA